GADQLTVSGSGTPLDATVTTINAGPGVDQITVGDDLRDIEARLLIKGDANDTLSLVNTVQSDLTLARGAGANGVITGTDIPGRIEFEPVGQVDITLSDT